MPGLTEPATVQALARGLAILGLFTPERTTVTLAEASRALDLPAPSTHRLLNTLEAARFVEREPRTGAYRLGFGLLELVPALLRAQDLGRGARPHLARLATGTGESANLAALDGDRALYLLSQPSHRLLRTESAPGLRLPAHCTALGKALLAQLDDDLARAVLGPEPYQRRTHATRTTFDELAGDLAGARATGIALSEEELEEGLCACAVAVGVVRGRPHALNVALPSSRWSVDDVEARLAPALREAAAEVAGVLGVLDALPVAGGTA